MVPALDCGHDFLQRSSSKFGVVEPRVLPAGRRRLLEVPPEIIGDLPRSTLDVVQAALFLVGGPSLFRAIRVTYHPWKVPNQARRARDVCLGHRLSAVNAVRERSEEH